MYRVSPFTYLVDAMLSVGLANTRVVCAPNELLHFEPPSGQTCAAYMARWIAASGGYLDNPAATADCGFCAIDNTNTFLRALSSSYANRWRNFGIMWAFIVFNVCAAVALYYLVRVPKKAKKQKAVKAD